MNRPLTQFAARSTPPDEAEALCAQEALVAEWLETDGLGGYAASTAAMCPSRRYHGLLVAPFPGTARRHLFLAGLLEHVVTRQETAPLSALRSGRPVEPVAGAERLALGAQKNDAHLRILVRGHGEQGRGRTLRGIQHARAGSTCGTATRSTALGSGALRWGWGC